MTKYKSLQEGKINILTAPNFYGTMFGSCLAKQDRHGTITIVYTDGTEESRKGDNMPDIESLGFPSVIGFVQAVRGE